MSNCCDIPNPLIRDGVSQRQRQAPALSPSYVKVDERELADFLVFAYQLAQQLIYYNDKNQIGDDWLAFWQCSTPVWLALISKTRPQEVKETYDQQLYSFLNNRSLATLAPLLVTWTNLLTQIKDWYEKLEAYTPFKSILKGLVKTNLGEPLFQMQAFEQAYVIQTGQGATEFNYQNFADTFNLEINSVPASDFIPLEGTLLEARNKLDTVFQVLWQNYRQLVQLAPHYLIHSLKTRQDHQPHLALYFAFLEVMKPARDDLNRMTQQHLNFFYCDVLRLPKRPAEPDQAHLIFELAKSQTEYKLQANTRFKAGKDATGVELFYQLDEEIVVHRGQVTSLRGLFLDSQEIAAGTMPQNIRGLFASPVANSLNGEGQDFPKDQVVKAWLPFGNNQRSPVKLGIAIASDVLLLQEGKRTITLQLTLKENLVNLDDSQLTPKRKFSDLSKTELLKLFKVNFSGEKSWIEAKINSLESQTSAEPDIYLLTLEIILTADLSPVVSYSADVHGLLLETDKPVLLLQLNTEESSHIEDLSPYHFLRSLELSELTVTTEVDQVRNLVLQNDLGVIDPTKSFPAFGSQPKSNANLYIGSQEVFQKPLITELNIHLVLEESVTNWSNRYAGYGITPSNPGQLEIKALRQKIWEPEEQNKTVTLNLFSSSPLSLDVNALEKLTLNTSQATEPIESWTHQSNNGFLRLKLTGGDFLHDEYPTVLARQVLAGATNEIIKVSISGQEQEKRKAVIGAYYRKSDGIIIKANNYYVDLTDEPIIPQQPYTPVVTSLYLSYTAAATYPQTIQEDETKPQDIDLFHLYPFDGFKMVSENNVISLFPTFNDEGILYIGLKDLDPPTALPLLFQVAEETADTDLARADVKWYYLKDNSWEQLQDHQIVSDTTKGLIASGIVNLAIPADISKAKTTILDPNFYWLKVSVPARSQAICHMIGLHTQAAAVSFNDQGNDPNHIAVPLAAGTISKLAVPQPQVKTVEQPYDSFGGEVQEQATHFYTRISEHLRHKGRAVTIFDCERLVLEKFPQIYKVRCINHGQVDRSGQLQELMPGAVTLAVIPDLSQRSTTNDLEPKVNINLLGEIENYLAQRSSPWVEIRAVNPQYERIRVKFQVQFQEPYQANFGYYRRQLEREIIGFLSPWTIDKGTEIHFGGKMYRSSILNFIEERTYVDYVLNFEMDIGEQFNVREAAASTARSILVSVPFADSEDQGHIIKPIEIHPANQPIATGKLGYESVEKLKLKD